MQPHWEDNARHVARQYPELLSPLGWDAVRSGFSGAKLWRVTTEAGSFALRAWPPEQSSAGRLDFIHAMMELAAKRGLRFVPALLRTADGATWRLHGDRCWEVSAWMAGQADFSVQPSLAKLLAAIRALSKLHRTWRPKYQAIGPSPGVQRRMVRLQGWPALRQRLEAANLPDGQEGDLVCRSLAKLVVQVPKAMDRLQRWTASAFPLQPCLADVWHDHVLFRGDKVTGIIDYGSLRKDHVSVDLARLLGSLAPGDAAWWAEALEAYSSKGKLLPAEWDLVRVLDGAGIVVGVMNWLDWLVLGTRAIDNRPGALLRWTLLLRRLENMP